MRIHKYISLTGFCSRREGKRLLENGRITINGVICNKDTEVEEGDIVLIDRKPIPRKQSSIYMAFNKPVGITCTANPEIEGNILQCVNVPERVFPVGRLDKASQGLILLTNDGELANRISQSDFGHEKEYEVTVDQPVTELFLQKMSEGVPVLHTVTRPAQTKFVSKYVFRITLTQGLNRQIRRMCKALGYEVEKLERIRIMNIHLHTLQAGEWRDLKPDELLALKGSLDLL
ncbi:pseudouridine synthase [Fictibacillus phosphorivorans]|uniref:pseudouridine synthase n=1 Tax=Fictibacillus phosphorivorans TaxID=1221500 RepID=UPI00203C98AE|nr:pseudouridine synthase [Fictibacillus phosphorivorans]MCM3719565.1 pseudouridine synthase [Fictibacillus phosphorivorans]MCM3777256.1 pseudouridine synthase [Fictibacillus phosphorivorans]